MDELISNILRGSVSSVMYVLLLFTLTKPRFGLKGTVLISVFVFVINIASALWFYFYSDLTSLSRFTIILFIIVGFALKPLTRLTFMQWCFTFLTTINMAMMIIILSFHLGKLFPSPEYVHTAIRFILYLFVIFVAKPYLKSPYISVVKNWPAFSFLMVVIFLNLSFYFYVTEDIYNALSFYKWPLLLLVSLSLAAYGTVFYSMQKLTTMYALETENMQMKHDANLLQQTALQMEAFANYDMLTGLPNRRYFFQQLQQLENSITSEFHKDAVLYIDLDTFKHINDTYGHLIGDQVLIQIGSRLLACVRKTDVIARIGGDEFAVILKEIGDSSNAERIATSILQTLQEPISINSTELSVNASIGISIFPDNGKDSESLIRNADSALYEMKRNGKGGVRIFNALRSVSGVKADLK